MPFQKAVVAAEVMVMPPTEEGLGALHVALQDFCVEDQEGESMQGEQ
jgi:hypothetical protein